MEKIYVKGESDKEKFESIERTLQSFSRRLGKKVIGVIPPVPLFAHIESVGEDGIILQVLSPFNGKLVRACLGIRDYEGRNTVKFSFSALGVGKGQYSNFSTRKNLLIEELDLPIDAGDMITLKTESPERVKGVFVGASFDIDMRDLGKKSFLIEEFSQMLEEKNE